MKFQLLSDNHSRKVWLNPEADLIVHAGDFGNSGIYHLLEFVKQCNDAGKPYVLVLGNHDLYTTVYPSIFKFLDSYNINYLVTGKEFKFEGITFVGDTLFTNFRSNKLLYEDPIQLDKNKTVGHLIYDFHNIGYNDTGFVTPNDYITEFNKQWNWIQTYKNRDDVVVVTHFPPHMAALSDYWANNEQSKKFNPYFVNDMSLEGFKLWTSGHCVDMQTEILTESGWKFRSNLDTTDRVYTYNSVLNVLELESVLKITDMPFSGTVYTFKGKSVDQRVTDLHRMVGFNSSRKYTEVTAAKLSSRSTPFTFIKSGIYPNKGVDLSDKMLELYIAIAADGSLSNSSLVRFCLHKERKKNYVKNLLDSLSIEYRVLNTSGTDRTSINFTLPEELRNWNIKGLDSKILNCNVEQFKIILNAYSNTDGCMKVDLFSIFTSKKTECDFLSHLSIINGYSCTVHARDNHGFSKQTAYTLTIGLRATMSIENPKKSCKSEIVSNEDFWCITVKNENFFMRRNGKISLTGNTHTGIDKIVDGCRLVINPMGHSSEDQFTNFSKSLLIEV